MRKEPRKPTIRGIAIEMISLIQSIFFFMLVGNVLSVIKLLLRKPFKEVVSRGNYGRRLGFIWQ